MNMWQAYTCLKKKLASNAWLLRRKKKLKLKNRSKIEMPLGESVSIYLECCFKPPWNSWTLLVLNLEIWLACFSLLSCWVKPSISSQKTELSVHSTTPFWKFKPCHYSNLILLPLKHSLPKTQDDNCI